MNTTVLQPNFYSVALLVLGMLAFSGAAIASQRRGNPGANWLAGLMTAMAVWSSAYAFEILFSGLRLQIWMAKIEYFGITTMPVFWFLFAMDYTGRGSWARKKRLPLLGLVPLFTLCMVWTNELHGQIWTHTTQVSGDGLQFLSVEHGAVYWAHTAFSYTLILLGSILVFIQAIKTGKAQRMQAVAILVALAVTWLGNIIYHTPLNPFPYLDPTSFTMTLTGLILIFSLLRVGALDLFPVVSETVLEGMNDGVLVLDEQDRVLFANQVLRRYANIWPATPVGRLVDDVLEDWPNFAETFRGVYHAHTEVKISPDPTNVMYFDLRITPILGGKKRPVGRILVFHDISERKQAEERLSSGEENMMSIQPQDSSIPLVLVLNAADGKIVEVNRSFLLVMGTSREQTIGRTLPELGIWADRQQAQFMRQIREQDGVASYPFLFQRRSSASVKFILTAKMVAIQRARYIIWMARR